MDNSVILSGEITYINESEYDGKTTVRIGLKNYPFNDDKFQFIEARGNARLLEKYGEFKEGDTIRVHGKLYTQKKKLADGT